MRTQLYMMSWFRPYRAIRNYRRRSDTLDGHVRLRHTGGMVSFMSAMHLDLDSGLGAFASINAQLGYRPNPVAQFALQLLRSEKDQVGPPASPDFDAAAKVADAHSYSGVYTAAGGRRIEIRDRGDRLILVSDGNTIALQQSEGGIFIADHAGFDLFPIVFERARESPAADAADKPTRPITSVSYGAEWFARAGYHDQVAVQPVPVWRSMSASIIQKIHGMA